MSSITKSDFRCVHEVKLGRWRGQVRTPQRLYNTNYFSTPEEAARAVDRLTYKIKGPDAPTNFALSDEERQRLDGMTLAELDAEFRAAGQQGGIFSSGRSQYRGVCWDKQNLKWKARIFLPGDGCRLFLGRFPSEADAAAAYDAAAWMSKGRDAKLNFPEKYAHLEAGQASPTLEADIPDPRACSKLKTATRGMGTSQGTGSARSAPGPENAQDPTIIERHLHGRHSAKSLASSNPSATPTPLLDEDTLPTEEGTEESDVDNESSSDEEADDHDMQWAEWVSSRSPSRQVTGEPGGQPHSLPNTCALDTVCRQLDMSTYNDYAQVQGADLVEQEVCSTQGIRGRAECGLSLQAAPGTVLVSRAALNAARKEKVLKDFQDMGMDEDWAYDCYIMREILNEPNLGIVDGIDLVKLYNFGDDDDDEDEVDTLIEVDRRDPLAGVLSKDSASQALLMHVQKQSKLPEQEQQQKQEKELQPGDLVGHISHAQRGTRDEEPLPHPMRYEPLSDFIFPSATDADFHMAVADAVLRRMFDELGMLDHLGQMPGEERPTHMLALRRQIAAESAAQARSFEKLPPLFNEDGAILQSLARVRHPEDEFLAEALMEQVARAVEGMPLSIPLSRISWIQDPEPGPGPLRPRGTPAPSDHPAFTLYYLSQMNVPLEEELMHDAEKREHQARRIALAKSICAYGRGQRASSHGAHESHTPSMGPAASRVSPELFNSFIDEHMRTPQTCLQQMGIAEEICEAMRPTLPMLYGSQPPSMVWEPVTVGVPNEQERLVYESKALHAAAKQCTLEVVDGCAAAWDPRLKRESIEYDPLGWYCFVRCFFDAWMGQAVIEFARLTQPKYMQRKDMKARLEAISLRRQAVERECLERAQEQSPSQAAQVVDSSSCPPWITVWAADTPEAIDAHAAALAAMAEGSKTQSL